MHAPFAQVAAVQPEGENKAGHTRTYLPLVNCMHATFGAWFRVRLEREEKKEKEAIEARTPRACMLAIYIRARGGHKNR
jgi:hypothetical protein